MKTKFYKEPKKEAFLMDTCVENLFISEYMINAPGDYVKIYLFALMYAELGHEIDNSQIARQLELAEEDVLKAWSYWEAKGLVRKHFPDRKNRFDYEVGFINLKELVYGTAPKTKARRKMPEETRQLLEDAEIKEMYRQIEEITGRMLDGREPFEIMKLITDYGALPEVIVYGYAYCAKNKKQKSGKYVAAIIRDWLGEGLTTREKIEEALAETDKRHYLYKRILKSLGFLRNPTEEEKRMMDRWLDEMGFEIEKILEACAKTTGIANPNMNYVNKILINWHGGEKSGGSRTEKNGGSVSVRRYYDAIREEAEAEAAKRKAEIYREIPRIRQIDEEMKTCGIQLSKTLATGFGNSRDRVTALKKKAKELEEEKAFLLTEHNFSTDYMEVKYRCHRCGDTGTDEKGERCSCFSERLSEASQWQKQKHESSVL